MSLIQQPTVDALTPIWERVLARSPIGSEETFFALGGNRPLVDLLFAEIAVAFGRELPSATIDCAPTIASLSALLNRPGLLAFSPFVLMKPGSEKPPVFIVHGLSGSIGELAEFVSHIETTHAIYGIQAKGIDGLAEPLERVEDMAALYLASLGEIEPSGPYIFIGYSFGGLIALEMAQRLSALGKQVALTMLDTNLDPSYLPAAQRLRLILKRLQYHIHEMQKLPFPGPFRYISRKAKVRLGISPDREEAERNTAAARPLSFACASNRVMEKGYIARAAYQPRFYNGRIRYVVAETESFFLPHNPAAVWGRLVENLDIETIPGNHMELVRGSSHALGLVLTRHIQEAVSCVRETGVGSQPSYLGGRPASLRNPSRFPS